MSNTMDEGEKRAAENAFNNYMNNLNDQWDAACVVFKTRIHSLNEEFKELDGEIKHLKNALKNYKKTFTEAARLAKQGADEMDEARGALYKLLSKYPVSALEKIEKICEILNEDRY